MNGLGKQFRKNSDPKNPKNSKNESAAFEQKTISQKANVGSNTVFSLYLKNSEKNSCRKTNRFFLPLSVSALPKSVLQFDKNHENV